MLFITVSVWNNYYTFLLLTDGCTCEPYFDPNFTSHKLFLLVNTMLWLT